jgi:hypothetical protein
VSTIARFTASSRLFGNEEPGSCGTGLSTIHKGQHKSRRDRLLESRIAEQDGGRFTPQFQRDALHRGGAVAHDRLANGNRASERYLGNVGIAHEFGPYDITAAYHDIADSLGELSRVQTLKHHLRLQRAQLTGLDHDRTTSTDGRR